MASHNYPRPSKFLNVNVKDQRAWGQAIDKLVM